MDFTCFKPLKGFIIALIVLSHCYPSKASFMASFTKIAFSFTSNLFNSKAKSYLSGEKYLENCLIVLIKSFSSENLISTNKLINYFESYCLLLLRSNCESLYSHSSN